MILPGLYVHIPFCAKKCDYCDFLSYASNRTTIDTYLKALAEEAAFRRDELKGIGTVFVGGGTPSLLEPEQIRTLGRAIGCFDIGEVKEFTVEANPGTLDDDKLKAFIDIGANRLSLGAQSFIDKELVSIGRIHRKNEISAAFSMARAAGFRNINLDIMFGLPGQTLSSFQESLSSAAALGPEHISAYCLELEPGTPLFSRMRSPVPEDGLVDMYRLRDEYLASNGYLQYEISNFSRPGMECSHNINYWKNGQYLGIGLGASSHIVNERYKCTSDPAAYLAAPCLTRAKEPGRSTEDELSEKLFMGLRMNEGLDLAEIEGLFGRAALLSVLDKAAYVPDLFTSAGGRLSLTQKGMLLSNTAVSALL